MGMKSSFSAMQDNILTRKFGGTRAGTAEPYVTGYFFIWFQNLPPLLDLAVNQVAGYSLGLPDIQNILAATCLNVTPPGGTINKVDFSGLGGIKWAVPGSIDYGNEVTVRFFEFQGTPLLHIIHSWVKLIRDYRYGITDMLPNGAEGDGYAKKTYAGSMFFWTTSPDGMTVQYYAGYDGVFPTKDPQDLFTSDIDTVGRLELEIGFNVDYVWHEPWVKTFCTKMAKNFMDKKSVIAAYGQPSTGGL